MSYPQQPGNWSDPSWSGQDPKSPYADPAANPTSGQQPGYAAPTSGAQPEYPAPTSGPQPEYAAPGYAAPGYPAMGYPAPAYGYPGTPPPTTNGLAIASMVVAIVGALGLCGYGLGGYLGAVGAIMGHVARKQIRERGESGEGMAMAGIIVGWIATGIAVIATIAIIVLIVWAANQESSSSYSMAG